jgi:hypothetical protein
VELECVSLPPTMLDKKDFVLPPGYSLVGSENKLHVALVQSVRP